MEESPFAEVIPEKSKTPRWIVVVEKLVASFFLFVGFAMSMVVFSSLDRIFGRDYVEVGAWSGIRTFLRDYGFTVVLISLFLFSGITLLIKKKVGWMAASVTVYLFMFWSLLNTIRGYITSGRIIGVNDKAILLMLAVFGYIIFFLNRKSMRTRYSVTKTDYRTVLYFFISLSALRSLDYFL